MGGRSAIGLTLLLLAVLSMSCPVLAWGPAGHAVIGIGVAQEQGITLPRGSLLLQAVYGTSGPDFAWGASESLQSALGGATHDSPATSSPGIWRGLGRRGSSPGAG